MARNRHKVFLGYEDEPVTDKYQRFVNYTSNKLGGKPDCYDGQQFENPRCKICGLTLPLIVQIYAPMEKSSYHRTLYIFGCVNPNCWNHNESWICLRSQSRCLNTQNDVSCDLADSNFEWCDDSNNWEDGTNDNISNYLKHKQELYNNDLQLSQELSKLVVNNFTEKDTPSEASLIQSHEATAEIEGEEGNISVDTPDVAQTNITDLLKNVQPVPQVQSEKLQFMSFFINVCEEDISQINNLNYPEDVEYGMIFDTESTATNSMSMDVNNSELIEKYEKGLPLHGDKFFHRFVSRIQMNPGQLLRYIREGGSPLFLYPIGNLPQHCQHCNGELIFEVQLLPTLISCLQLVGSGTGHIEFGTVFVLACQRSCWKDNDSPHIEYVIVQREM